MRKEFFQLLHTAMKNNVDIFFLTGDLGFGLADSIMKDYPERAKNCGASEQAMLDIAVGLAQEGKIPFVYSITPFLIYRPFETIRTYIDHEQLNVKLIGSGRDDDYRHDGYSHAASDVKKILKSLEFIDKLFPKDNVELAIMMRHMCNPEIPIPEFLSLSR